MRLPSTILLSVAVVSGCAGPTASGGLTASAGPSDQGPPSPVASVVAHASPLDAVPSSIVEPGDPTAALTGRAVEGIATGGPDVVLRIGAEGFRLPGESIFDVHDDRVLSARAHRGGASAELIVRDLEGNVLREIDTGMQIPQTGIVRGEDVYFGGIDAGPNGTDIDAATDQGGWVARGDAPPERIRAPGAGLAIYHEIERSPDGNIVGFWRCGVACSTTLIRRDGAQIELPNGGLIAMSNGMALQIGGFNEVVAYSTDDGRELWRAGPRGCSTSGTRRPTAGGWS